MIDAEFLLPNESDLAVDEIDESRVAIKVSSVHAMAKCPYCDHESNKVNTSYYRKPADLPCAGHVMVLQMKVRSFFCENEDCEYRTFAERFPEVVAPYARRTERLATKQQEVAFAVGGEVGARLLLIMGMPISPDTLIRLIRRAPEPEVTTPRVLGVDDWAKKKGQCYGTILVDLEAHRVIDLLDERSAESLSEWLQAHPGVEIISRDRATDYIKGATDGAPKATQVADRWHLLKNLHEALERLLTEKPACLKAAAMPPEPQEDIVPEKECNPLPDINFRDDSEPSPDTQPAPITQGERQKQARHDRKQERYDLVCALHEEGLSMREIGRRLQMSYRTVSKYLRADSCPFYPEQVKRGQSKLDPFLDYLNHRWEEGCHTASQLFREICEQNFGGSRGLVARWAADQRRQLPNTNPTAQTTTPMRVQRIIPWRPKRAAWLLFTSPDDLEVDDQLALERIFLADSDMTQAHQLVHSFQQMVREQQPELLSSWLQDVKNSGIAALKSFANGIQQDLAAVTNALSSPWSNGQTEGQAGAPRARLKFIKRQMYGRPNLIFCGGAFSVRQLLPPPFHRKCGRTNFNLPKTVVAVRYAVL